MSNNVFEYTVPWNKLPPENIEEEVKNQVSKFPLADANKISLTLKCTPENFKMEIHKNINIAEAKGITNATVQEINSNEPAKFKKAFNKIANNVVKEQKPVKLEFIQNLNESINKNNINNMNTGIANDKCNSSGNTDKKSIENQESSNLIKQDININKKIGKKNDKISLNDMEISEIERADNKLFNDQRNLINKSTENDTKSTVTNLPTSTGESVDANPPKESNKLYSHEEQKVNIGTNCENTNKEDLKKQKIIETIPLVKDTENVIKEAPKEILNVGIHEKEATDNNSGRKIEASKTKESKEIPKPHINKEEPIDVNKAEDITKSIPYEEKRMNVRTNTDTNITEDSKKEEIAETASSIKETENKDVKIVKEPNNEILKTITHEIEPTFVETRHEKEALKVKDNIETPKTSNDEEEPVDINKTKGSIKPSPHEEQQIIETDVKQDTKRQENMEAVSLVKDTDKVKDVPKEIQEVVVHEKEATNVGVGREAEVSKIKENVETSKSSIDNKELIDVTKTKDTAKPILHDKQKTNVDTNKEPTVKEDLKTQEDVSLVIDAEIKDENVIKETLKEVVAHEKEATNVITGQEVETLKTKENIEAPKSSDDKNETTYADTTKDSNNQLNHEEQKIIKTTTKDDLKKQENIENIPMVKDSDKAKEVSKEIQEVVVHEKEANEFGTGCEIEVLKANGNTETPKSSIDKEESTDINSPKDTNKPTPYEEQKIIETTIKEDPMKQENIENVPLIKDADIVKEVQEVVFHEKEATDIGTGREIEPQKTKENTEIPKPSIDRNEPVESNNKHEIKEENEKKSEKDCQIATDNESKIPSSEVKIHEEPQKNLEDPTQESNSSIIGNNKETETVEKKENMETSKSVSQKEPIVSNVSDTNEKKKPEQNSKSKPNETKLRNNVSEVDKGKEIPEANTQENSVTSAKVGNNEIYEDSSNFTDLEANEVHIETKTPEIKKTDELLEVITQEDVQDIVVEEERKEENVLKANEVQIKASADISENELEEQVKEMPKNFTNQQQRIRIPLGVDGNIVKNEKIGAELQQNHDQEENKNTAKMPEKTIGEQPKDNVKLTSEVIVSPFDKTKINENQEPAKIDERIEDKTQEDSKIYNKNVDLPLKVDEINKNEESLKSNAKDDTKTFSEIPNEKVNNQVPGVLKPKSIKEDKNNESKTSKSEDTKETVDKNVNALVKKDDAKTNKSPDNSKPKTEGTRKWSNLVNPLLSDTNEETSERAKKTLSKALPNNLLIQSDTSNSSTSDTLQSIDNTENLKINNKKKRNRKIKKSNTLNENEEKSSDLNLPLIIGLASIVIIATIIVIRRN